MFTDFFYILRKRNVPVSLTEWMTLMETLDKGYITNLDEFYFLARAILVKSETYFDHYDVAFQEFFKGIEAPLDIPEQIREWVRDPLIRQWLEQNRQKIENWSLDKLIEELEKRIKEQKEQHDGGDYWIGRTGISPFGHSGTNPAGIRIGGESGGRGAVQIAQERRFRNYRADLTLDTRQIKMALKKLRRLNRIGPEDELDLDKTIEATAKNVGDLELKWRRQRKNAVKVLLMMDAGGSMEPYALLCSQLFSAASSSSHFKDLQYYYFHNCVYSTVYRDMEQREGTSVDHILHTLEPDYRLVMVGDARMSPYELVEKYGAIYYHERNEIEGIVWLKRLARHFSHGVWLNPEEPRLWIHPTVAAVGKIFPMFPLTLDGLNQAVRKLVIKK